MNNYYVSWDMEFEAESPEEAAQQALLVHRDKSSEATCFTVTDSIGKQTFVDLLEQPEEDK